MHITSKKVTNIYFIYVTQNWSVTSSKIVYFRDYTINQKLARIKYNVSKDSLEHSLSAFNNVSHFFTIVQSSASIIKCFRPQHLRCLVSLGAVQELGGVKIMGRAGCEKNRVFQLFNIPTAAALPSPPPHLHASSTTNPTTSVQFSPEFLHTPQLTEHLEQTTSCRADDRNYKLFNSEKKKQNKQTCHQAVCQ